MTRTELVALVGRSWLEAVEAARARTSLLEERETGLAFEFAYGIRRALEDLGLKPGRDFCLHFDTGDWSGSPAAGRQPLHVKRRWRPDICLVGEPSLCTDGDHRAIAVELKVLRAQQVIYGEPDEPAERRHCHLSKQALDLEKDLAKLRRIASIRRGGQPAFQCRLYAIYWNRIYGARSRDHVITGKVLADKDWQSAEPPLPGSCLRWFCEEIEPGPEESIEDVLRNLDPR